MKKKAVTQSETKTTTAMTEDEFFKQVVAICERYPALRNPCGDAKPTFIEWTMMINIIKTDDYFKFEGLFYGKFSLYDIWHIILLYGAKKIATSLGLNF
jgi:hypothetical protein